MIPWGRKEPDSVNKEDETKYFDHLLWFFSSISFSVCKTQRLSSLHSL